MRIYIIGLLLLCFAGCSLPGKKPAIAVVSPHLQVDPYAFRRAADSYKNILHTDMYGVSEGNLPVFSVKELSRYQLVIFEGLGARISLLQPQIDSLKAVTRVIFLETPLGKGNIPTADCAELETYWSNANEDNYKGMLSWIAAKLLHLKVPVIKPVIFPENGFYYPGIDTLFHTAQDYLQWYNGHHKNYTASVGLVFYQSSLVKKDMRAIDALIRSVEAHGARPVTFLAKGGFALDSFLMVKDTPVVDVVIYGGMFLNFRDPEKGRAGAARLDVPLLGGITHYYKDSLTWENDPGGFAPDMSDRFFFSERDGVFEPMAIATEEVKEGKERYVQPIQYQVSWRVERALAWARLRHTPEAEKKIVVTYYSEGGGRSNVGADIDAYLDVPGSLAVLLKEWKQKGYNVGNGPLPDADSLALQMSLHAAHVGNWASGAVNDRINNGDVIRIPEQEYLQWFHTYPQQLQEQVAEKWGRPPGNMMIHTDSAGKKEIIIPIIRYGNILLAPHPNWGLQDNPALIYGRHAIPPNHAYLAFYEWMKRVYRPHAFLSLFTQLSLMPGKEEGPSAHDFAGLLIGNIPHINYSPLIAGAGPGNKRRANALTIGYITGITRAGLSDSLQLLNNTIADWQNATNAQLKYRLQQKAIRLAVAQHLQSDLQTDSLLQNDPGAFILSVKAYLRKIEKQHIPDGGHILGQAPKGSTLDEMVRALSGGKADTAANRYKALLQQTGNEVSQLMRALDGHYIPTGPGDDPIRNPAVLPSGRYTYGADVQGVPSKEAWEMGKHLASQLLLQYEKQHGRGAYPGKVAFVLWSSEITLSQGVTEAEILYLLGVQPVWNSRGQVMDVKLIPPGELGRPRLDVLVTTSGTYRDHFGDKINMLDKAVHLAAAAPEPDNMVRKHTTKYMQQLKIDSPAVAALRIFSSDQGAYSTNLEFASEQGKTDTALSNLYLSRMAFAYGEHVQADYRQGLFALNVRDVQAAAFSRSSSVYGIMDHPMVAAYFGAYNLAVKNTGGGQPSLFINDLQDPTAADVSTLDAFYHKELRSRYLNPKWIGGMMSHGYDGARYMESFTENLLLWNTTNPEMVKDQDWNDVYDTYVTDKNHLGLSDYFQKKNPFAYQTMMAGMMEAAERGYWQASDVQLQTLAAGYTRAIAEHGPTCNTTVCNNPALSKYVKGILEKVPGGQQRAARYDAQLQHLKPAGSAVQGKVMEERKWPLQKGLQGAENVFVLGIIVVLLVFLFFIGWKQR